MAACRKGVSYCIRKCEPGLCRAGLPHTPDLNMLLLYQGEKTYRAALDHARLLCELATPPCSCAQAACVCSEWSWPPGGLLLAWPASPLQEEDLSEVRLRVNTVLQP